MGFAIAEQILAGKFNQKDFSLIDHYTYVLLGDGCLMEGISHESASIAGTLGLGKLIAIWDDNGISIDGEIQSWCADDVVTRFESYGWQVISGVDGHDANAIEKALKNAKLDVTRPTLVCCKTIIGYGSQLVAGTAMAHGGLAEKSELEDIRESLQWQDVESFGIPQQILSSWRNCLPDILSDEWYNLLELYQHAHPGLADELCRVIKGDLPHNFAENIYANIKHIKTAAATRKSSGAVLAVLSKSLPELVGGSADLSSSNCVNIIAEDSPENYIHYGVREFGMFAITSGLVLHGGIKAFCATFLVFSDYARNAIRLAAMMQLPIVYVLTHDSIAVGEDGPTHQPIEHIDSLRVIPGLDVWRPCDLLETAVAWVESLKNKTTTALLLSRQSLEQISSEKADIAKGGYVLFDPHEKLDGIILATGSEVSLALKAAKFLYEDGTYFRVVSVPCFEVFLRQSQEWQEMVLPTKLKKRIAIEAGTGLNWLKFVRDEKYIVSVNDFGFSAPGDKVMEHFGFTFRNIVNLAQVLEEE